MIRHTMPGPIRRGVSIEGNATRRQQHQAVRHAVQRSNRPIKTLLQQMMVRPDEIAVRIRRALKEGRSPSRLLRCIDQLEIALSHRGIRMQRYFTSLRQEAARALGRTEPSAA